MARAAGRPTAMGEWVQTLGEQIGTQLGQIIAESVQRTLEKTIDVGEIARRLGAGKGASRRGRRPATGEKAICSEQACAGPVLAKGLCRSHYYRARYRALKPAAARRGRAAAKASGAGRKKRGPSRTATGRAVGAANGAAPT